jgi:hypothetical protein
MITESGTPGAVSGGVYGPDQDRGAFRQEVADSSAAASQRRLALNRRSYVGTCPCSKRSEQCCGVRSAAPGTIGSCTRSARIMGSVGARRVKGQRL